MPRTRADRTLTAAMLAARNRRANAVADLREQGIELRADCTLTLAQIEALAEVAGTFTEQEG